MTPDKSISTLYGGFDSVSLWDCSEDERDFSCDSKLTDPEITALAVCLYAYLNEQRAERNSDQT